ncbi:MAG: segregation/condensation protein A [Methanoculleaceae archaeon]
MTEDPVEILVGLAERGEIDPWNIDIVDVTDRFLEELDRRRELNLRISGRTLFFASTLLRMKSEYIGKCSDENDADPGSEEWSDDGDIFEYPTFEADNIGPIDRLEMEIRRRLKRKRLRTRPVTLYELISQLRTAEKEERRRHRKDRSHAVNPPQGVDALSLAHVENYEELADPILTTLQSRAVGTERVTLRDITAATGYSARDVYISLLFLMLDGKVVISQSSFFGELYVESRSAT